MDASIDPEKALHALLEPEAFTADCSDIVPVRVEPQGISSSYAVAGTRSAHFCRNPKSPHSKFHHNGARPADEFADSSVPSLR